MDETLWDIWPDEELWASANFTEVEERKKITIEQVLRMIGGLSVKE